MSIRRKKMNLNINTLKNGYEEMGKINLNFAKEAMYVDSGELVSYEEILASQIGGAVSDLERDDFDD